MKRTLSGRSKKSESKSTCAAPTLAVALKEIFLENLCDQLPSVRTIDPDDEHLDDCPCLCPLIDKDGKKLGTILTKETSEEVASLLQGGDWRLPIVLGMPQSEEFSECFDDEESSMILNVEKLNEMLNNLYVFFITAEDVLSAHKKLESGESEDEVWENVTERAFNKHSKHPETLEKLPCLRVLIAERVEWILSYE